MMKIGFIGLGNMGVGIAGNLLKAGHDLTVWNRSSDKAEPLIADGATLAPTPRAAAQGAEVVLTMLADDVALEAVLAGEDGLLAGLATGALHISLSTIAATTADTLAQRHADLSQLYISAPVFGRPDAAAAARLAIVAGGPAAAVERARPLFDAIGNKLFHVSETPSAANIVKLSGNFMILSAIEAMAESMALVEKCGVAPAQFLEVMTDRLFDSPVYHGYGASLVEQRFRPAGFVAPLGLKDMRLVGAAAEQARVPMPLLALLRDQLIQTLANEGQDIDWSGIGLTVAKNAGLKR